MYCTIGHLYIEPLKDHHSGALTPMQDRSMQRLQHAVTHVGATLGNQPRQLVNTASSNSRYLP